MLQILRLENHVEANLILGLFNRLSYIPRMDQRKLIPTFYLYGEPHRLVSDGFVHAEPLVDRSGPNKWTIKPHSHAELCHVFLITTGGGRMAADDHNFDFQSPSMLLLPAATVHGFSFLEESAGTVITLATRYIADLGRNEPVLAQLFSYPRALKLSAVENVMIKRTVDGLVRELGWSAPGHRAAVDATILSVLVAALRNAAREAPPTAKRGRHAAIVARLRERIEERYRLRESVAEYAAALGLSETALRAACSRLAGSSPGQMLDQRALLEARRNLLYSNLSVTEIGYSLGFPDPAYFSRFFARHVGVSPSQFRKQQGR